MDCPICTNKISNACVGTCMHHFCYPCLLQWISRSSIKDKKIPDCPVCRKPIYEIRFDREFDIVLHGDEFPTFKHPYEIEIKMQKCSKAGLTVKNNIGPGVEIINVNETGLFYKAGFRKGHVILFINNIPCNNHKSTIDIINYNQSSKTPLIISTLTKI